MIAPVSWASLWNSALFVHLWQSTVFVIAIWLLTLAPRRNAARARYRLWLIASAKFAVPLSLLVAVGQELQFHFDAKASPAVISSAMESIEQPLLYEVDFGAGAKAASERIVARCQRSLRSVSG